MANVFLCLYSDDDKKKAISLGAIYHEVWDKWYIDVSKISELYDSNIECFSANIYTEEFYLAQTFTNCQNCKSKTIIYAVIIGYGYYLNDDLSVHEVLKFRTDIDKRFDKAFVINIEFYDWELYKSIIIPHTVDSYRSGKCSSAKLIDRCITNHCLCCGHQISDISLFFPDKEFGPLTAIAASKIIITKFNKPLFLFGTILDIPIPQFDEMKEVSNNTFISINNNDNANINNIELGFQKKSFFSSFVDKLKIIKKR